mmetsp:Transcript_29561/g.26141  ORF Transcript_29561/g.26141 Transcript_29561/m.26141 type:complete len:110 (-) Transcript_29561:705-1034(-)
MFDQQLLTPIKSKRDISKRRRLSTDNYLMKFQSNQMQSSNIHNEDMVHVDDHDIQSIIEEDDKHHEELKYDLSITEINHKPDSINNVNIPKFSILKIYDELQISDKRRK